MKQRRKYRAILCTCMVEQELKETDSKNTRELQRMRSRGELCPERRRHIEEIEVVSHNVFFFF